MGGLCRLAIVCAALVGSGCASYPVNRPLETWDPNAGYRFGNLRLGQGNTDETFVILTLSGGGTRAAAFAYGVLKELAGASIGGSGATLLDEVDVISSVSGGSFAAAYYGLFGKQAFIESFEQAVLHRKIERDLILRILAPWNWLRLLSKNFGRSDLAAEYYDRHIFLGRRFGELPDRRPLIQLNATDISLGARFSFVQDHFDRLCSDLSKVKVSRGVTASSAFPVAFTPLTLKNYPSERCGYRTAGWVKDALEYDLELNPSLHDRARTWKSYEDAERRYIHLSDGGLADNIGLRGPMLGLTWVHSSFGLIPKINQRKVERIVLIVVDAKPEGESKSDRKARPPGFLAVLNAAATNPMENYSSDTIELSRKFIERWNSQAADEDANRDSCCKLVREWCKEPGAAPDCEEKRRQRCFELFEAGEDDSTGEIAFYRIHVRFEAMKDDTRREKLKKISTRLQLPRQEVALLVGAGRELLLKSPAYQRLLVAVGAEGRGAGDTGVIKECPE